MMKKVLVRFEPESKDHVLVINEIEKYLGKLPVDLVDIVETTDNLVEEDDYFYSWCHKDLLEKYLIK